MKRISTHSLSTSLQLPSKTLSLAGKSTNLSQNPSPSQETSLSYPPLTEKPAHFHFPDSLFAECFPSAFQTFQEQKTYRKLQHHSLDKNHQQKPQKFDQERKTLSLKDSFLSFGKQKISNEIIPTTATTPANQCFIADMIGTQESSKCNVYNGLKNTGRSSFMASTRNTIDERWQKYQSTLNSKLFLSQDFKIPSILTPVQPQNVTEIDNSTFNSKYVHDQKENITKKRRLSTDDSVKFRENAETDQSQAATNSLEIASLLCESIPVNFLNNKNAFEFDPMKESLIDKLNSFRKEESFIQSKKKIFIRSNKKILQESPRFCNFEDSWNKPQNDLENEEEFVDSNKTDSKETIEEKNTRNKITTLKDCGKTIVSKYNKSSERKSVLQESNIVFQASKMVDDPNDDQLHIPTFSDSQVVFDVEIKQNFQNDKPYSSFIHQIGSCENCDIKVSSPKERTEFKKLNRTFLRSKKSSSQKQIRTQESHQEQIRFNLDTFIEYKTY